MPQDLEYFRPNIIWAQNDTNNHKRDATYRGTCFYSIPLSKYRNLYIMKLLIS